MQEYNNLGMSKRAKIVYALLVGFATIGSSAIGIQLSSFRLSPFRMLLVILVVLSLSQRSNLKLSSDISNVYKFWIILFAYGFVTYIWAKDKDAWFSGTIYLTIGIVILFLFLKRDDIDDFITPYRNITALALFIVAIWGWYEIRTGNYFFLRNARFLYMYSFAEKRVPVFVFANTNNYALYVTFSLLLLFPMLLRGNAKQKCIYFFLLALCLPLMIISKSRACVLGLILGLMVWWFAGSRGKMSKKKIVFGSMILITLIVLIIGFGDTIFQALDRFFYLFGTGASSSMSNNARINLFKNALNMVINTFGFGVGSGNSAAVANHVYDTGGVYDLHNWWLLILSEYGLVFGIVHVAIYLAQIRKLVGYIRVETRDKYTTILLTFLAIDIAFVICLISPSNVVAFEWLWVYWGIRLSWINHYSLNLMEDEQLIYNS